MNEPAAEGVARGLKLLRSLAIAILMHEPARAEHGHEQHERHHEWAKRFHKKGLHQVMILEQRVVIASLLSWEPGESVRFRTLNVELHRSHISKYTQHISFR